MPHTKAKAVLEYHPAQKGRSYHQISSKYVSRKGHGDEMNS